MTESIKSKVAIVIFLWVMQHSIVVAQQLPLFTQFSEFSGLINPSYIPMEHYHFGHNTFTGIAYRDQWNQLPDRPKTFAARFEKSTDRRRGANLVYGGTILHDEIGVFTTTELKGRISTYFKTSSSRYRFSAFALGLNLGIGQYRADLEEFAYINVDPILFQENSAVIYPDVGFGVSYVSQFYNDDYLQVGIGVPQIFALDHTYSNNRKEFNILRLPHLYFSGTYYRMLSEETYLEIATWVKHVKNIPLNYDFIVRYRFAENLWIGAGANNAGILHTEAGIIFESYSDDQIKIGYAFNPTFHTHSLIFGNIHELNIAYNFTSKKR